MEKELLTILVIIIIVLALIVVISSTFNKFTNPDQHQKAKLRSIAPLHSPTVAVEQEKITDEQQKSIEQKKKYDEEYRAIIEKAKSDLDAFRKQQDNVK